MQEGRRGRAEIQLSSIGSESGADAGARGALDIGRDEDMERVIDNDPQEETT